jgi:hypothetical protein
VRVPVKECSLRRYPSIEQSRRFESGFEAGTIPGGYVIPEAAEFPKRSAGTIHPRIRRPRVGRQGLWLPTLAEAIQFDGDLFPGRSSLG